MLCGASLRVGVAYGWNDVWMTTGGWMRLSCADPDSWDDECEATWSGISDNEGWKVYLQIMDKLSIVAKQFKDKKGAW